MEGRAMCLEASAREIQIKITPKTPCVNPVFEIARAPRGTIHVTISGRPLETQHYAWDGRTLWLDTTIDHPAELRLSFSNPQNRPR
jgi:hypothetical protein